jgi:hypothetical protein
MDVYTERAQRDFPPELKRVILILKGNSKSPIFLKGSASLQSIKYPADYDFFTTLKKFNLDFFIELIRRINNDNFLCLIELKFQVIEEEGGTPFKYRVYKEDDLKEIDPSLNYDFVKIDLVDMYDNNFEEISCIYKIKKDDLSSAERTYVKQIMDDISELKRDKSYYKILKRLFAISKLKKDRKTSLVLTKFFNSDIGLLNKKISMIDAVNLALDKCDSPLVKKRAKIAFLNNDLQDTDNNYQKYKDYVNQSSYAFFKKLT